MKIKQFIEQNTATQKATNVYGCLKAQGLLMHTYLNAHNKSKICNKS